MAEQPQQPVIEVHGLDTRVGDRWVHRGLELTAQRGEVFGLVGGSGSGKTLLMRQIIGLLRPQRGEVRLLGEDMHRLAGAELRRVCRRCGVLFQQDALFSAFTVFDNIAFPLRELRQDGEPVEEDEIHDLVHLKLQMVGLGAEVASRFPGQLSGGMAKRAALARALALDAELLLLDEPWSGLDPVSADGLDRVFLELRRELGLSAFMITHDVASLAAVCDRVAVLAEQRVLTSGTLQEVAQFDHPYVRHFFRQRKGAEALRALPRD